LAFEERYKDTGCQVLRCYFELLLGGGSYEISRKNKVGEICFRSPTVLRAQYGSNYEQPSFTTKKNVSRKPEMLYVWLLSFEPGPNPARARTSSVLSGPGPGPGLGMCRPSVWARAAVPPNVKLTAHLHVVPRLMHARTSTPPCCIFMHWHLIK
jgi:hypothetical protein